MYLEMQPVDDTTAEYEGDDRYRESVAASDSPSQADEERERLVALLQCAYSWSRVQALREVDRWVATEGGGSLRSRG
jgi:hypothetical protein